MTLATPLMESLIARCPQLQLTDSARAFPDRVNHTALRIITVGNAHCRATIASQGAQLLTFETPDGGPLLWLSPKAIFQTGKAIRGGIPLCLPWFGPHPSCPQKPQHGFARNREWTLLDAQAVDPGCTRLVWELQHPGGEKPETALFDGQFRALLTMTLNREITLELVVHNTGNKVFPLSWALHSYHPVTRLSAAEVSGLDQCHYWDNANRSTTADLRVQKQQTGNVHFVGEVDRLYTAVPQQQQVHSGSENIVVTAENCQSAIVWNPGPVLAANMIDVGEQHYQEFVCVERGNAAEHTQQLYPGDVHRARLNIRTGA